MWLSYCLVKPSGNPNMKKSYFISITQSITLLIVLGDTIFKCTVPVHAEGHCPWGSNCCFNSTTMTSLSGCVNWFQSSGMMDSCNNLLSVMAAI